MPPTARPYVVVYGDCCLDAAVRRPDYRATQEDPTVRVYPAADPLAGDAVPGGAANLAANLAAMGCEVALYAPWCLDPPGRLLERLLGDLGVGLTPWGQSDRTTVKTRYYAGDRLAARVDADGRARKYSGPPGGEFGAVVLSDYGKGAFPDAAAAAAWASRGRAAFADPYPGRVGAWRDAALDTLVMNWAEAESLLGVVDDCASDAAAARTAEAVTLSMPRAGAAVVKRGRHGSAYAARAAADGRYLVRPYLPAAVCDAQGAGDTYLAGYVTGRLRGLPPADACHLASAAAGVAVSRPGTAVVTLAEAAAALGGYATTAPPHAAGNPEDPVDCAARDAARARSFGLRVGYTNGCFDGRLHAGHRRVLAEAARRCDVLFVGVDSDARVRRLKGPDRPAVPQAERAAAVGAAAGVRAAFVFDADPAEVLARVNPDLLFKGGDYARESVPEIDRSGWAGEFVHVGTEAAESTTDFLGRVRSGVTEGYVK